MTLTVLAKGGPLGVICNPFINSCSTTGDSSVMRLAGAQLKQLETSPPALGGGEVGAWVSSCEPSEARSDRPAVGPD